MAKIANVALTNTFDTWRIRSNQSFNRLSQFAIDESKLYANTLTANVRFVSSGATKLGSSGSSRIIVNGLLSSNGNLNVSGNTVLGASGKTISTTGLVTHTGRQTISTNLTVSGNVTANKITVTSLLSTSGNTTIGDAAADNFTLNGNTVTIGASMLNIDTGLLFIHRLANRIGVNTTRPNTALDVNGIVRANSGFKYPDGATTTAPLYVYYANGAQAYP